MRKYTFDNQKACRVILYLRVSKKKKNQRSLEQQEAEILRRIKARNLPWVVVAVYRDDGISGRLLRKRAGYQQMMRDIRTGVVSADLILVDTLQRFGRVDELQQIRTDLINHHGVLIMTADNDFSDPTTPQGKIAGSVEAVMAVEDGRVKAHNVARGKRDHAEEKFWPGGPTPFGFTLLPIFKEIDGTTVLAGSRLQLNPEESRIIKLLYEQARDTGWGQVRLTRWLNDHPDIPESMKPFNSATVGRWLACTLYRGELSYGVHTVDIIGDDRVTEKNPTSDVVSIPEFCEAIVTDELWKAVQALRAKRAEAIRRARDQKNNADGKQIKARAPGMTLKHLLTGLVRCGICGRAMTPSSTTYTNVGGVTTTRTTYVCPRYIDQTCSNGQRVPEEWLRITIVALIRVRLFPAP